MSFLTTPLADLPGLGTKRAQLIAEELDLHTYRDLLYYIPHRFADALHVGGAGRGDLTTL